MKRLGPKVNIKAFRLANNLFQKDISEYLGTSIAFISAVERGSAKLPQDKLELLLDNDQGWDTSTLVPDTPKSEDEILTPAAYTNVMGAYGDLHLLIYDNKRLSEENERLKEEVRYWREQNERLLSIMEGKYTS